MASKYIISKSPEWDKPSHGTVNRYANHQCRCERCCIAWSEYQRERYRKRKREERKLERKREREEREKRKREYDEWRRAMGWYEGMTRKEWASIRQQAYLERRDAEARRNGYASSRTLPNNPNYQCPPGCRCARCTPDIARSHNRRSPKGTKRV